MPRCLIFAGPNGAGKTTFAKVRLPALRISHFVNADEIAASLSGGKPDEVLAAASRMYLIEIEARIKSREDFAFETTLSGRGYLKLIERLKHDSWEVAIYYLALPDVEMSKARVVERVAHGGHDIPIKDIERRFSKSLRNLLNRYSMKVDKCYCYMNIGNLFYEDEGLIFVNIGDHRIVGNETLYDEILRLSEL